MLKKGNDRIAHDFILHLTSLSEIQPDNHYGSSSVKSDYGEESFSLKAFQGFKPGIGFALGFAF